MRELNVTSVVILLTLFVVLLRLFSQPNLKPSVWQRAEKIFLSAEIVQSISRKPGELILIVNTKYGKLLLYLSQVYDLSKCRAGNRVEAQIKIYPIKPGFKDFREIYNYLLYRQGFIARAWADSSFTCLGENLQPPLRLRVFDYLKNIYGDTDVLSMLCAMNLGTVEVLSEGTEELFKDLGLSHTLVVSGFHVGLVYTLFYFCFDYFLSRNLLLLSIIPSEFVAAPIGLVAASFFCYFSGQATPCFRALLFLFISTIFKFIGSSAGSLHRLFVTFLLVLVFDLNALFDLSLYLSLTAVIGVICGLELGKSNKGINKKIISFLAVNFLSWLYTLPICLIFFGNVSIFAPILNIFLLPLVTFFFSIVGGLAIFPGLAGFQQCFYAVLVVLDYIYLMMWNLREYFSLHVENLEFEISLKLAIFIALIDLSIFLLIKRFSAKKTDDFLQLAPA